MCDPRWNIAFDQQVILSLDRDGLRDPPVGGRKGDRRGSGATIDGDLVSALDGEGNIRGGSLAQGHAVLDRGAGIFCEPGGQLAALD